MTGLAVDIFPKAHLDIREVRLKPIDTLLGLVDGVTDARYSERELLDSERLCLLLAQPISTAAELPEHIQAGVQEHTGGTDPFDDITLLAVRRQ